MQETAGLVGTPEKPYVLKTFIFLTFQNLFCAGASYFILSVPMQSWAWLIVTAERRK